MKYAENILDLIGNTPLVRIQRHYNGDILQGTLLAKLEYQNPAGSVKDRIAKNMIEMAEKQGLISPDKTTIIEPTSGNTGIGLAFICASKGYKLILTMPESMSIERRILMQAYGANIILTPAAKGMKGAIKKAEELLQTIEHSYMPQQFNNKYNPAIHYETTAKEIWQDTGGQIDVFVAGVGTGGTISGVSEYIKQYKSIHTVAVEPTESPVISGGTPAPHRIQGIGAGFIPKNLNKDIIDEIVTVSSDDAIQTARYIAKTEGILAGISSGATLRAAMDIALSAKDKVIVCIIASNGERYLSSPLYHEEYQIATSLPVHDVEL